MYMGHDKRQKRKIKKFMFIMDNFNDFDNAEILDDFEKQIHVYLLLHDWKYISNFYGKTFYVAPFETTNIIYGRSAAITVQRKNERGEDVRRD